MLLALVLCQLSVLAAANPFHKYPFVFLLDVGNEELEKTNSEQIRLSIPGGSVALRYPAIGDGNTIGHIRVSGIDFGTDLKANIVDGGPGYKYVVLVFMGNPRVPYDAVVTVQTVTDPALNIPSIGYVPNSSSSNIKVQEDPNNSAEDVSDGSEINEAQSENVIQNSNAELMESSHNVYSYAENEVMDQNEDYVEKSSSDDVNEELNAVDEDNEESDSNVDEGDNESDQRDIHKEYNDDIDQINDPNIQVKGIDADNEDYDEETSPELAQSGPDDFVNYNEPANIDSRVNSRTYVNGGEVYYEDNVPNNIRSSYQQQPLDYEDPDELEQVFNDGEVHGTANKYRDTNNNNYIDSDDSYAVAY